MDKEAFKKVLSVFDAQDEYKIPEKGWFNISCFFAKWTHAAGKLDNTPSASVLIDSKGKSAYKCWACNKKGSMLYVLHQLKHYDNRAYSAIEIAAKHDSTDEQDVFEKIADRGKESLELFNSLYSYIDNSPPKKEEIDTDVWDESELEVFQIDHKKRQEISEMLELPMYQIVDWEIGYDKYRGRITFPIRRFGDSALVSIVGRQVSNGQYKNYLGMDKKYLFGEHRLLESEKSPIVVVEGMRDVIHVSQLEGIDVVGTMGVSYTKGQVQRLIDINRPIILLGDGDVYGHNFNKQLYDELSPYLYVTPVYLPIDEKNKLDPQKLSREELLSWIGTLV